MDRKSFVVLAVAMLFIMSWSSLMQKWYPRQEPVAGGTNGPVSTNLVVTNASATNGTPTFPTTNAVAGANPVVITPGPVASVAPLIEEQIIELDNELARYVFTSHGGGIKRAELKKYPVDVTGKVEKERGRLISLNSATPVPIGTIEVGDQLGEKTAYTLSESNGTVVAEKVFPNGFRIVKTFRPTTNYLVDVTVRFENVSTNQGTGFEVPEYYFVTGTGTPMNAEDNGMYVFLNWFNGSDDERIGDAWFLNKTLGCIPGTPRGLYRADKDSGAVNGIHWAAVMNQFFTIAAIPKEPAPRMVTRKVGLDLTDTFLPKPGQKIAYPHGLQCGFGYPKTQVKPGSEGAVEHRYTLYIGPKEYKRFEKLGIQMKNELDLVMDFDGFFGFFARALLRSMNGLHDWGLSYAWAIICITVIIKMLFWPLTNASTKSMKRMSQLQPQMKELQEKYKDNPQKMNQKLMEFMKENKVNPMGGCLPMLLQLPVFFGFFTMLRGAVELRGETFLWVKDLTMSDTVFEVGGFPINPLPILMGVTMLWQSTLQPPSPGMDPAQQKVMKYMPMIFVVFLYNFSSALTLYWTVQNLLTILQTKVTKAAGDGKVVAKTVTAVAKTKKPRKG
jgi:YidC/Oxa1 family membrane protein insertase